MKRYKNYKLLAVLLLLFTASASATIEFRSTNPIQYFTSIDLNSNQINNLATPTEPQDASTKQYVDDNTGGGLTLSEVLANGNDANTTINMSGNSLTNVGEITRSVPSGYIRVPGSTKRGTEDFYVMKYEAKDSGGTPVSQASGSPWVSINQFDARKECRSLGSDYHLITEAEWMTIADNAMRQSSNWADGNIGSKASNGGGMYLGNVDPSGNHSHLGYNGPNPDSGTGRDTTARLQLSNGNQIWDLSGNVWEWTNGYMTTDGVPEPGSNGWTEYTGVTNFRSMEDEKPLNPAWNADNGIGRIYLDQSPYGASKTDGNIPAVRRGGYWNYGADAGALSVTLDIAPSYSYTDIGFRCAKNLG